MRFYGLLALLRPFLVLLVFLFPAPSAKQALAGSGAPAPSLDEILKAWSARQAAVKSFRFKWVQRSYVDRDSVPPILGGKVPTKNIAVEKRIDWLVGGEGRSRIETQGKAWSFEQGKLVPSYNLKVSNARTGKVFDHFGESLSGQVSRSSSPLEKDRDTVLHSKILEDLPIQITYRPLDYINLRSGNYRIMDRIGFVDGNKCLLLEEKKPRESSRLRDQWWLLPKCDFMIARYVHLNQKGLKASQITIHHKKDPRYGWVPANWRVLAFYSNSDIVRSTIESTVQNYEINPVVDDSLFELEFPVGTGVVDMDDFSRYFIREGGKKEMVPADPGWKQWVKAAFNKDLDGSSPGARWLWWFLLLMPLLVALVLLLLSRWRRRRMTELHS